MKSFVKTRGILGMLVMGVGVLMVTAGCAVGGVDEAGRAVKEAAEKIPVDNIKNTVKGILDNKIYNIDDFGTVFKEGEKILEGDVEKTVLESEGVKKLRLDVGGCEVTFVPSEDEDFWVEAENVQKFQAYVDGEELHVINTSKEKTISGINIKNVKIFLYVPTGFVFDEVKLELGASIVNADDLAAKTMETKIGAGELKLKSLQCEVAKFEIGAGDANVKETSVDKLECKVGAGNFDFEGELRDDVTVDCAMGNVRLGLKNNYADFDYELKCAAGNIDLNGKKYAGLSKEEKIDHDAKHDMKLQCAAGNIMIVFE